MELAPRSGESFTALRDVGLFWWGRRIPQDLLSKERSAADTEKAPSLTQPTEVVAEPAPVATPAEPPIPAPDAQPPAPRPRAGIKATRALERRLVLPDTFTLDGRDYNDRRRESDPESADELWFSYTAAARPGEEEPKLRLFLAPRDSKLAEIDLRGELRGGAGQVAARFDWITTSLVELARLSSPSLAALLGVPVRPFPDLPPEPDTTESWETTFERHFTRGVPYRLTRTRKSGGPVPLHTFAVYRDDASPDRALASFDLFEEDDRPALTDLRFVADVRPAEQERIRRQIEDALRHLDHLQGGEDGRDPMALMVELLEQQTRTLRARKSPPPRSDDDRRGVQGLVALLQDLADPIRAPSEFQEFLEARGFSEAATILATYLAAPDQPLTTMKTRLWSALLGQLEHAVTTVDDRGRVRLAKEFLRTDARGGAYVLALLRDDPTAPLERIALPKPVHEDIQYASFERGRPLGPGALVYAAFEAEDARYEDDALFRLHDELRTLLDTLQRAPTYLADVRRALQLAGTLVDTALCQGDSRRRTLAALAEAKTLYDNARRHLLEGRTAGALERIRKAMERIALAAVELGRACAEGVQALPGVATGLAVDPIDRQVLTGKPPDTTAAALAALDALRPDATA